MIEPIKRAPFEASYAQPESLTDASLESGHKVNYDNETNAFLSPHANDDDPKFPVFWQQAARQLKADTKPSFLVGTLAGVLAASLFFLAFSLFTSSGNGSGLLGPILMVALTGGTLFVLALVTERISRLANIITKTSEFEKNLNNSGRVAALSRELEFEASQIETRIEKFLSVGTDLRLQLHRESGTLNDAYQEKLVSLRTTIEDLDAARLSFLNEIDFVNQAIEIGKNFISAKIGVMSADFEDAAMAATRILESRLLEIAQKVNMTIASDIVQKRNFERLIATNASVIELMDSTPELLNRHLADVSNVIDNGFRQKVDVLSSKIEELSQALVDTGEQWVNKIHSTPELIEKQLSEANAALQAVLDSNHDNLDTRINTATTQIRELNERFATQIGETPAEIEKRFSAANAMIETTLKSNQDKLDHSLAGATDEIRNINQKIQGTIEQAPKEIEVQIAAATRSLETALDSGKIAIGESAKAAAQEIHVANEKLISALHASPANVEKIFAKIEASLKSQIDGNIQSAKIEIELLVEALAEASSKISSMITDTPDRISSLVDYLVPAFEAGIIQNIKQAEDQISAFLDQQSTRVDETLATTSKAISEVVDEFNKLNPNLVSEVESQVFAIQNSIHATTSALEVHLKSFEQNFSASKDKTVNEISGLISGQISQIRILMEQARLDSNNAIGSVISQQNLNLREFEKRFEQLTSDFVSATEQADALKENFSDSIQSQMTTLRRSSEETLGLFEDLVAQNSRVIGNAFTPDFAEINRSVDEECNKLEDKLQMSLAKFYDIVKRCTETIEEASIKKLDDDIRVAGKSDATLKIDDQKPNAQEEFDRLTERLRTKIDAIKSSRDTASPQNKKAIEAKTDEHMTSL